MANFKNIVGNITSLTKSENIAEKINNTIQLANEIFEENNRINNLILNFLYNLSIYNQSYFANVQFGFYIIISVQFSAVLLTLLFFALNFLNQCQNRFWLIKLIGHFNWLLAACGLIINSILIACVFFIGSVGLSFGDGIKNLKLVSERASAPQPHLPKLSRCFEENGISSANFYSRYESNLNFSSKFAFSEFNSLYAGFIAKKVFHFNNLFEQAGFLNEMQKYLKYLEQPNNVFLDLKWDQNGKLISFKRYLGNGNAELERLLDYKNSFPAQFYMDCAVKIKLQMNYDHEFCEVPLSRYNKTHDAQNRFCYAFQEVSKENFTEMMDIYDIKGCRLNLTIAGNRSVSMQEVLETRFLQLSEFFKKFDEYKSHFYQEVIGK